MSTGYGCHRVRWSKADDEFQVQCDTCLEFLPLTIEYWAPKHGLTHCRACYRDVNNVRQRAANRSRRANPKLRAQDNAGQRAKRAANRDAFLEYRRAWYRANRERVTAQRRALYAAQRQMRTA